MTNQSSEQQQPAASEEQIRKIYVKNLKAGETVTTVFRAQSKEKHVSRSGKAFLALKLVDRTGEIDSRIFENVDAAEAAFMANDYLLVHGKIGQFHGKSQLVIDRLERLDPGPIDEKEFAYTAPVAAATPAKEMAKPKEVLKDESAPHKSTRARLSKLLDNPQFAQAIDVVLNHLEKYIDDRIAARTSSEAPRPPRRTKGPQVDRRSHHEPPTAPASEQRAPEPARDPSLPEGLAFKPFSMLVGEQPSATSSSPSENQ